MDGPLATEIEYDILSGTLYAEGVNGYSYLYTIDPTTGQVLDFVTHDYDSLNGLEFVGSTLYGTFKSGPAALYSDLVIVDTSTGALTNVGPTGFGPISGLAYDETADIMYGVTAGPAPASLVTINLSTGAATVVGPTGLDKVGSIEFGPDGNLYGGVTTFGSLFANYLVQIDLTTGVSTPIGDTGFSITGLTSCLANQPPDCNEVHADPDELWPPNHKYVDIGIMGVTDPDGDPLTITITGITQDEEVDAEGTGDGNTSPDGMGVGTDTASVRSERQGTGNGRVYEISFTATDPAGAECSGAVQVCVPHDQSPGQVCIDDGQVYDSTVEYINKGCKSDFDCDGDVDGSDAFTFKTNFGRKNCTVEDFCLGDFDEDADVDGSDAFVFKSDFGTIQ
jgi:hypothetical protein